MRLNAPAKLNLYLNVLKKRPDGYHEIETLFERIDLCDTLTFFPAEKGVRVTSDSRQAPGGPSNIVTRAARLLEARYRPRKGVRIHIRKRIPVAAGLGGGSSDAAAALTGLNRFWHLGLSRRALLKHAAELGSDVPFFMLDTPFAVGRGRGEKLKALKLKGLKLWHVVVKPAFGISTKEAYGSLKRAQLTPSGTDVNMLVRSISKGSRRPLAKLLKNSLEVALNKRLMSILNVKRKLTACGASACLMSGSGSSVFGLFDSRRDAVKAAGILAKKNKRWKVFVAATH